MNSKVETVSARLDTVKLIIALLIVAGAIAAFYIFAEHSLLVRVLGLVAAAGIAIALAIQTEKGRYIWGFFQDAQIEVRKVVWPTRDETIQTTLIVLIMVIVVSLILWGLDWVLGSVIGQLLGRGG
jgi:preprotein translocase subunit SecE